MFIELVMFSISAGTMILLVAVRYAMAARTRGAILTGKNVGPAYWGVYAGSETVDQPALKIFKCLDPGAGSIVTAGSARYASGQAVKSARG